MPVVEKVDVATVWTPSTRSCLADDTTTCSTIFLTNEQLITLDLARLLMVAKFHVLIIFQNLIEI